MKIKMNEGFKRLKGNYVFADIRKKIVEKGSKNLIDLSVGDAAYPIAKVVGEAMKKAADEMSGENFKGYPPASGYPFLKTAIKNYYIRKGVEVSENEVFVSDGAKSDIKRIVELFGDLTVTIFAPGYPPQYDCAALNNKKIEIIDLSKDLFVPNVNRLSEKPRLIFLCSPSNPCGTVISKAVLKGFVDYALKTSSMIVYDSAYADYIGIDYLKSGGVFCPYEVDGARKCVIEIRSLSKFASFTGIRCGWSVVPGELVTGGMKVSDFYTRKLSSEFNGVGYIVQRGAEAALSIEGEEYSKNIINIYLDNAFSLAKLLKTRGVKFFGGENSPYVFFEKPLSWGKISAFEYLFDRFGIAVTPGEGFVAFGKDYARISCLKKREEFCKALRILKKAF